MAPKITTEAAAESNTAKGKHAVVESSTMIGVGELASALPHVTMREEMAPKTTTESAVESSTTKGKQLVVESSTMIGDGKLTCALPHDTMLPILVRLPVKSLCRFKCVCKTWRYLFSNPKFVKIHHDLFSGAPKKCFLQPHLLRVPRLGVDPGQKLDGFVMESCRGLVCMGRPSHTKEIILWNPATNLWKPLPLSKTDFGAAEKISLGFGCSDEGGEYDYKVVRIFSLKGKSVEMKVGVEVYSSKSDCWQTIEVPFKFRVRSHSTDAIVNGDPYWAAFVDEKTKTYCQTMWSLLGFDSKAMSFKVLPLFFDGCNIGKPFVEWKGRLGVLRCVNRSDGKLKSLEVGVYDDAKKYWMRVESFEGMKMPQAACLECSRTGKIAAGGRNKLFVYDPSKRCVVGEGVVSKEVRDSLKMMPYNESLAFVEGMESMLPMKEELQHQHDSSFFNINNIDGFFAVCGGISCYYPLAF